MKSPTKRRVLKELRNVPIVSVAAKATGVSRQTVYRWMQEDKEFAKELEIAKLDGVKHINDMSESQLLSMIQDKKWPVIKFWLRNHHPDYKESTPKEKADIVIDEKLTEDDIKAMEEMLAKFIKPKEKDD